MSNSISPTKKRKANDGRAATDSAHDVSAGSTNDGGGFLSSWFGYFSGRRDESSGSGPPNEKNTTQLNRMEEMMMRMEEKMTRMEEKLATVNTLESKCEELERMCSSLDTKLEFTSKATKEHIDRKCGSLADRLEGKVDAVHKQALMHHEFNEMMLKNQSWQYSAALPSVDDLIDDLYTEEEAEYLIGTAKILKALTTTMRRGEFIRHLGNSGVHVEMSMSESYPQFSYEVNNELIPHWNEFAAALERFTPAINLLPENCESSFTFYCVQMNHNVVLMMKKALMGKPFRNLYFTNNSDEDDYHGGMTVDAILDIVESNKHLRKLEIFRHDISNHHIERLCSAVRNYRLVELDLCNSFDSGDGDEMLTSLLTIDDLTLEKLVMSSNNITTVGITLLAEFLATNPRLKELTLQSNNLNDSDAVLIANALRSNTTLRCLNLNYNGITDAGQEALRRVLWDNSSLNAAADTNHCCKIDMGISSVPDYYAIFDDWNSHEEKQINRGRKIYHLLSSRNKTMSNAQHFGDIEVKILPNMLEAVQKYYDASLEYDLTNDMYEHDPKVNPFSIVYEAIRKWDKAFPLYKLLGAESIEN